MFVIPKTILIAIGQRRRVTVSNEPCTETKRLSCGRLITTTSMTRDQWEICKIGRTYSPKHIFFVLFSPSNVFFLQYKKKLQKTIGVNLVDFSDSMDHLEREKKKHMETFASRPRTT